LRCWRPDLIALALVEQIIDAEAEPYFAPLYLGLALVSENRNARAEAGAAGFGANLSP
jgi:hypothetical protein